MRQYDHPAPENFSMVAVLRALSDPHRLEIARCLACTDTMTCSALQGARPKSSMSHHFQVLRDAGVIHTRIEGVQHYNSLRRAELDARFPGLIAAILTD